ncbi:DUF1153 domain-containing protein [Qipengyuania sp. CAU 1752]
MPYPRNETIASRIKRAGLPQSHDIHWSPSRKREVVEAVREQLITFDEARWRYLLSRKEFETWEQEADKSAKRRERQGEVRNRRSEIREQEAEARDRQFEPG